jgi:hypothetical protein
MCLGAVVCECGALTELEVALQIVVQQVVDINAALVLTS